MASPLVEAHIEGERRLRAAIAAAVERVWRNLGGWNAGDAERFAASVAPLVSTGQRASVALTDAYLAQAVGRQPLGVPTGELIGPAVRNGAAPEEVYRRPFVTLWSALADHKPFDDAFAKALHRAKSTAALDVQLSMRATAGFVNDADPAMFGFRRVADGGACPFCRVVDGAYVKDGTAMPLHNHCGCGLEPLTEPHALAVELPSGVAVHQHGELGAVLTDPAHDFTAAAQALS